MYRVELKEVVLVAHIQVSLAFLMYRVELKVSCSLFYYWAVLLPVPNVPCGVESRFRVYLRKVKCFVPNVPCGVESYIWVI